MPGSNDTQTPNAHYVTPFFEFRTGVIPDDADYADESKHLGLEANLHAYDNQVWLSLKENVTTGETVTIKVFARFKVGEEYGMYLIKEITGVATSVLQFIPNVPAAPIFIRLTDASDGATTWDIYAAHTLSGGGTMPYKVGGTNNSMSV